MSLDHIHCMQCSKQSQSSPDRIVSYPDLQTIGKHCRAGYNTRPYIVLLRPIIILDMIHVIYPALY